uniref:CSON000202 protein n=1 Tax=Culicoides sonorensis TaxID=179676 RepID=A0A336MJK2_CULSO
MDSEVIDTCTDDGTTTNKTDNNDTINWQRFHEWLHCICVVTFDLEIGQAMEAIYPENVRLTEKEKMNICYLAFPDSNSGCMGDTKFHIRLRVDPNTENTNLNEAQLNFNKICLPAIRADPGHFWGYVYFRQIKDKTLKRGYFQKSIVLLSRLPFIHLFNELTSIVAPAFFDNDETMLNHVCHEINAWPALQVRETLTLNILKQAFQIQIPAWNAKLQVQGLKDDSPTYQEVNVLNAPVPTRILSSVHEIDIFNSLYCVLSNLHMLWELVLIGEPIVVIGTSPTDCSHMVQSLVSMISPLVYASTSRPYFTIHDSEFKEFTQRQTGPPSIILGVTNPFFAKTLQHWPHIIRLSDCLMNYNKLMADAAGNSGTPSVSRFELSKVKSTTITSKFLDTSPGVYTQYKPFLQRDKNLIKKVLLGVKTKRPASIQSTLIRRHLLELTQSFMIPLERYIASLLPLQRDISPFKSTPVPNGFKQDDFIATLENSGPHLTSTCKGDWEGLYRKFFLSSNFREWYLNRHFELTQTLEAHQLQALAEADLLKWTRNKQEVEIVDMILKLKDKLQIFDDTQQNLTQPASVVLKKETRDNLLRQIDGIRSTLPDDLKEIIK